MAVFTTRTPKTDFKRLNLTLSNPLLKGLDVPIRW